MREKIKTLYVSSMAVSPCYRRVGLASYALNQAAAIARKLCKEAIELAVIKENAPAIILYKRHGYRLQAESRRSLILRKPVKV